MNEITMTLWYESTAWDLTTKLQYAETCDELVRVGQVHSIQPKVPSNVNKRQKNCLLAFHICALALWIFK